MDHKSGLSHGSQLKVSGQRAGRLYNLLKLLEHDARPRTQLLRKLKVGMRTFYRDIDLLRECGVNIETQEDGYLLADNFDAALSRLPFPDPELTFGDVVVLMKGRSASHQKLRKLFASLTK